VIRYLMDQHQLKRADLVPLLGNAERVLITRLSGGGQNGRSKICRD
jgi:hypothetical protein